MNGDVGWLNVRLKNLRGAQKKLTTKRRSGRRSGRTSLTSVAADQQSAEQKIADDVIFLKSLVVSNENINIFIEKLNSTRARRMEMLLDKNIHLKEQFPYFFTNIELVNKTFSNFMFTIIN